MLPNSFQSLRSGKEFSLWSIGRPIPTAFDNDAQVEVQVENAGVEQVSVANYDSSLDQKGVRIVMDDPMPGVSKEWGG